VVPVAARLREARMNNGTRREDARLVRGLGRFVDDDQSDRHLHLRLVRSPYAHARVLSIDASEALALDGVVRVLTGEDVRNATKPFPQMAPEPGSLIQDYCMAIDVARFQGEPVAAVVARTPEIAEDAAELVRVDYEPLDAVIDAVASLRDEVVLHPTAGTNKVFGDVFEWGDVDGAFARADVTVSIDKLYFHRFSSTPLEPFAALVTWEAGGRLDVLCNISQPGVAMKFLAPPLGISADDVRLRTEDIGGGFGIKQNLYPYILIAAIASKKCGHRPVKWIEQRREHLQGSAHGNERTFLDTEVALTKEGEILAIRSKHVDDCGAYPRYEPLGCIIWSQVVPGPYKLQNIRIDMRQAVTNKCPVGPNRGFSRMQHIWFLERVIDICGHRMGIPADVIRQRNYVPSFPWTTPNGCVYDSGDYFLMLDKAKELVDWNYWTNEVARRREEGRIVGIGIGTTLDSGTNNFGQSRIINPKSPLTGNSEVANARLGVDGRVVVAVGSVPQGQGHETVAAQVVAQQLRIAPDFVLVQSGFDTDRNTHTSHSGTYASQFAVTSLGAIHGAVEQLAADMKRVAAVLLELPAGEFELKARDGVPSVVHEASGRFVSFAEVAQRVNTRTADFPPELDDITLNVRHVYRPPFQVPDVKRKYGNLTLTYAAQCHIAVVEIDPDTFNISILAYAAIDDCGKVINHAIVAGQVHGAAAHGIGAALMESFRYDEFGNLMTTTFSDYCPITPMNMPKLAYGNVESPSPFTFNGAKGMGEGGGGPLHTISAALQDALGATGAVVTSSHMSPSDIHQLLENPANAHVTCEARRATAEPA
jgi:2-furoyl-CoA dehydrogenase large subunit